MIIGCSDISGSIVYCLSSRRAYMAYCKYCGMDSKTSDKCEWCKRPLAQAAAGATTPSPPVDLIRPGTQIFADGEEKGRLMRRRFFTACGILILCGVIALVVRPTLYPVVILACLFVAGMLLTIYRIIPSIEDEWTDLGLPLILLFFFPALLVCAGYIAYGYLTRNTNITVIWVLSVYLGMLLVLEIFSVILAPHAGEMMFMILHGVEFVGMLAIGLGWLIGGSFRGLD
jgi:hypothetical protein